MAHNVVWFDIPVLDFQRALTFYTKVLRIEVKEEFPDVGVFSHGPDEVSGCIFKSDEDKPSNSGPLLYFNVAGRLDEAVAEAERQRGSILKAKHQIGPFGYRAIVLDSEGNRIALHSE